MTRADIRNDILRRVWIDDPTRAPEHVRADVATAVNTALQTLWLARGSEFFTSADLPVTITGGNASLALSSAIQEVLAVRLAATSAPLRPVFSRDDILHYRRRYEGATQESQGTPAVFWVEARRAEADDTAGATLYVAPTPSGNTNLEIEAKGQAPAYTATEMADAVATIGVAHQYVESLLLPVARYEATRFGWFKNEPLRETLREAANAAMQAQGLAAPWPEPASAKEEAA
jgi:hypothetical protein